MTAIQRFAIHGTIMNPHSNGPYVRHEDHLAAMQGRCLAQIEEPAPLAEVSREQYARMFGAACEALGQVSDCLGINSDIDPGAEPIIAAIEQLRAGNAHPVLDDRWKARMLDGRAIERDEMGLGDHPELPMLDEGMMPRSFFAALGLELAHTSAEDQLDWDVLGAMSEAVNWTDWQPTAPQGDGWKLVSIFDTEDGPVAWWLRELPEAEDGTTTIRILQAEVEKLKARIARRAGAAPAAVAHQGEYPPLPDAAVWSVAGKNGMPTLGKGWMFSPVQQGNATLPLFTARQMWAYHDLGRQTSTAAPALEAPAHQCCNSWFLSLPEGRQAVLRGNQWMLADAAYQAGRESRSALEAPAAPALSIGPKLARIMGYREHYRTWGRQLSDATELVESHPSHWRIVGEAMDELADALAAAPQAPAAPSAYSADLLAALGQWHQRCEVMGAHHTLTEAQIAELVVAGLLRRAHGGQVITTAGRAALAAPAAPAVDASDTALLDAMERERIAVIPEFEGPWDAQIFGEDETTLACGSGATPREAIAEALASLEARKAHDAAQAAAKGENAS